MRKICFSLALVGGLLAAMLAGPPIANAATTFTYPSGQCPTSSTGLNDCINNASNGDTIKIKPGRYFEHDIVVNHSVLLTGRCSNPGAVKIDATDSSGNQTDAFDIDASNVTIRCLQIEHAGPTHYGIDNGDTTEFGAFGGLTVHKVGIQDADYGIYQGGANFLNVTRSSIVGTASYGIYQDSTSNGNAIVRNRIGDNGSESLYFSDTSNSTIRRNNVGPTDSEGLYIGAGAKNLISENNFHTIESDGIEFYSTNTTIAKNTFNGLDSTGIYTTADGAKVLKNVFTGKIDDDVIELSCSDNAVVSGNKLVGGGTDDDTFIYVCQNTSSSETITNNSSNGFVDDGVDCSTCDNAVITGNTFTGGGEGYGVYFTGKHPTVNNNSASGGWDDEAIYVDCTGNCGGSSISANHGSGCSDGCPGFFVDDTGCSSFPCMTISNNVATDNLEYGFEFETSYAKISGNVADGNGYTSSGCDYAGFYLGGGGNNHVLNNTSSGNACQGFVLFESSDVLNGNSANHNVGPGFQVGTPYDSNALSNNSSSRNGGDGFNNDGTNTSFTKNVSKGNRQDCTNDNAAPSSEGATLGPVSGNSCADGSEFTVPSSLTTW